jgi:hypothetical protein
MSNDCGVGLALASSRQRPPRQPECVKLSPVLSTTRADFFLAIGVTAAPGRLKPVIVSQVVTSRFLVYQRAAGRYPATAARMGPQRAILRSLAQRREEE